MQLIQKDGLGIRKMEDQLSDFKSMVKWLNQPHVSEYYGKALNLTEVVNKYLPRIKGNTNIVPCMIEYKGKLIGYLQFYKLTEAQSFKLRLSLQAVTAGLDLFIGEKQWLDQGIGTLLIKGMLEYLRELGFSKVVLDLRVDNGTAISCYEKCGFKKLQLFRDNEEQGSCTYFWSMEKDIDLD